MAFTSIGFEPQNENESNTYELIEEGEYEASIDSIFERLTKNGRKHLNMQIRIRKDFDQKSQNRVLFETIWTNKDDNESYGSGALKRIGAYLHAVGVPDGKQFETIDELVGALKDKPLAIRVAIENDEYKNEEVNKIAYPFPSRIITQSNEPLSINSDDLPF